MYAAAEDSFEAHFLGPLITLTILPSKRASSNYTISYYDPACHLSGGTLHSIPLSSIISFDLWS